MKNNLINFKNYEAHKQAYGHVATWALWKDAMFDGNSKMKEDEAAIRKDLLIANSEADYQAKGLDKLLHGDVVILALNFSCPKETKNKDNPVLNILNKYKDESYNRERYEALVNLTKEDERFTFFNMYGAAARYYGPTFMTSDLLHGAYMTDFVKFVEEDGERLPAGIPDSDSGADIITQCLSKDNIGTQALGLKDEFDLLGIRPKVITLVSSRLNNKRVKDAIADALGYRPHFEQLHHYTPHGSSYRNRGYASYDEMFAGKINKVIKNIEPQFLTAQ